MRTNRTIKFTLMAGLFSLLWGCGSGGEQSIPTSPTPTTPVQVSWYADTKGVWLQQGYGNLMEINDSTYTVYQLNEATCIKQGSWSLDSLNESLNSKHKNASLDHLTLAYTNNDTLLRFDKTAVLPALCENGGSQYSLDPELNFAALWHTFTEQYAFFGQRAIDWQETFERYSQQVNSTMTEPQLFTIFSQMMAQLKDGHVGLVSQSQTYTAGEPAKVTLRIYDEFAQQTEVSSLEAYIDQQLTVIEHAIVDYLNGVVTQGANDKLAWGKLSPSVGYLLIRQMTGFSANSDASDLENLQALRPAISSAMAQLTDTDAMVIDLRLNGGGQTKSALAIAGYFVEQSMPAYTVKAKFAGDYTERQTIDLQPSVSSGYVGPVVILISGLTASAAELFVVTMRERGNVTIVGETTEGIFSNKLNRQLPNGWHFSLSNEVYQTMQGDVLEAVGIVPDEQQVIFPYSDRAAGKDSALDKAIAILTDKGF
jgi:carboxyl-terminal processing protease